MRSKNPFCSKICKDEILSRVIIRFICSTLSLRIKYSLQSFSLGIVEIDELFDQADTSHVERVTLAQFLAQYHMQKQLREEVNFITETLVPSVNLFEALDPSNTG